MKKTFIWMVASFLAISVNGQSVTDSLKKHYLTLYNQAVLYNDANTAIGALQGYLATGNNISYRDTLSMLYFSTGAYYSSLLLADEVHGASPNNTRALARMAECYRNLGDPKKAIDAYEKVVPLLKEPYYYYQLAASQYSLKRIGECESNLQRVMADSNSHKVAVNFTLEDGRVQQIPASAAAYNFIGIIRMEANDLAAAKTHLQQALKLYPDFIGAQQNLVLCESKMKPKTTTKPSPTKPKS